MNSHLTWLVEFNWWGRTGYIFAWSLFLVMLWPRRGYEWFSIPLFESNASCKQLGIGVVPSLESVPTNQILVLSGELPLKLREAAPKQVILINPDPSSVVLAGLKGLPKVVTVVGEFSQNKAYWDDQAKSHPEITVQTVTGAEDYIPQWMSEIVTAIKGS